MNANGLVVRRQTQAGEAVAQALGVPWEVRNKYSVHRLPTNKVVKERPSDPEGWSPTEEELRALEPFVTAQEESDCFTRTCLTWIGCGYLQPLKMHFTVEGERGDVYVIDRPYKCGGWLCSPLEMPLDAFERENITENGSSKISADAVRIGRVREDFSPYLGRCCSACCLATTYTDIERVQPDGSYEKRYSLRANISCCGRVNNCCAPTCLRHDAVYDILDPQGEVVAHVMVSFGLGDCCASFGRVAFGFTNLVLEFPCDSTAEDRALLLAALFQLDYMLFNAKGQE